MRNTPTLLPATVAAAWVVLLLTTISFASDGEDRWVTINNQTRVAMTEFYASNVGTDEWEEDIFDVDVLYSGESIDVNIDDGTGHCLYDLKAVFHDEYIVEESFNVCSESSWTVYE